MRNRGDFFIREGCMFDALQDYKEIIATWAMVIGLSMFGGLADAIMRYRREGVRMPIQFFLLKICCDLFLSAFAGVIAYFQREYIKTGIFDKKYSKYVQSAFQIRNSCDYDDFFIASRQDAEEQYQKAEELYEEVKAFLEK